MSAIDPQVGKMSSLRRSQRVYVGVDLVVAFERAEDVPPEKTTTVVVNAHGALVLLRTPVTMGELLTVRNVNTEEQLCCRVMDISSNSESGLTEVGLEFLEPAPRFWRVAFPPLNWTPRCPEAKSYRPQMVEQPVAAKEK
jgi:hypothetical protein